MSDQHNQVKEKVEVVGYNQATFFVEHSTNTKNILFVDPQMNLFVAICGL